MLTFVCWLWKPKPHQDRQRFSFGPDAVRVLRNMVQRHYTKPHRFVCVTDQMGAVDSDIETIPLWAEFGDLDSPHGPKNPSCYRRLKAFSVEAREWFGERFVSLDLDTVIVRNVDALFDRPEDFVCWGDTQKHSFYNGSMFMLTSGSRRHVYEQFDPKRSPKLALKAGKYGSDQGWLSYCLGPGEATWTVADGVYSFRNHLQQTRRPLPENATVVNFHGRWNPWHSGVTQLHPWVREHYR